jgi:hypothetical protein
MKTFRCTSLHSFKGLCRQGVAGILLLVFFCLATFAPAVWAQEEPEEEPVARSDWEFAVTPYFWMPDLNGNITLKGQQSAVDAQFFNIVDELFEDLQLAAMADIDVFKGRFGLFVNTFYANLFDDTNKPILSGTPLARNITATAKIQMLVLGFGAMYRVGPIPLFAASTLTIDPYIGGRYTYLDVQLKTIGTKTRLLQDIEQWAYPMIGGRALWDITRRWNLTIAGDVGGFDIGGSRLAWSATGLAGYRFNFCKKVTGNAQVGYRAVYQDYATGSGLNRFEFDVTMHGPVVGLAIGF